MPRQDVTPPVAGETIHADDARKPRHRHVFDTLLGEIASGRFQPGDRLPTEAELAKTFSASRCPRSPARCATSKTGAC